MGEIGKRTFDLLLSLFGLVLLSPFFVMVAILIKLDSRGPVLFVQERVGRGFVPFCLYKFRTMITTDQPGLMVTNRADSRITRVGRVLRITKIDELPQLLNVVKGDLSLVGPRPEVEKYVSMFRSEYRRILTVKPGITDLASVMFRNEEAILNSYEDIEDGYVREVMPRKLELYRRYVEERTFLLDVKIVLLTLLVVVAPGAAEGSEATTTFKVSRS